MTLKSKRTIVTLLASLILLVLYISYTIRHGVADMQSLATRILVFVGISVVVIIIINILFHIFHAVGTATKETLRGRDEKEVERIIESEVVEDEMDKVISLKASRIGTYISGAAFIVSLVLLARGLSGIVFLHVLLGGFFFASFMEGCTTVFYYERGV